MKIIGITGGTGAGKSSVCDELKKCGAQIIDADLIARQIVQKGKPALEEIISVFGRDIIAPDDELDRKKLGGIVFADSNKLNILNKITHKYIFDEMQRQINECSTDILVLDVPLLFEKDFPFNCDLTVAVVADKEERIRRIMARDGINRKSAEERILNQMSDEEYIKHADICFKNDGDIAKIKGFANDLCIS